MYYMETAIGQFARLSPLQIWRCAPIATGVGVGMLVLCIIVAIYYNVIMAYSIIYVGASFKGVMGSCPGPTAETGGGQMKTVLPGETFQSLRDKSLL